MITFLPTILETDIDRVRQRIDALRPVFSSASFDVMDGAFVPNATLFDAQDLESIVTDMRLEFHLMVKNVTPAIEAWSQYPNTFRMIFHFEATPNPSKMIDLIRGKQLEAGMAINPETPLSAYDHVASRIDVAHVMGIHPGFGGQEMLPETVQRVATLHARFPRLMIQVDCGVNASNVRALIDAGAVSFSVGSYFTGELSQKFRALQQIAGSL